MCIALVDVVLVVVVFLGVGHNYFKLSMLASHFLSSCLSLQSDDFPGMGQHTLLCFMFLMQPDHFL